MAQVQLKGNYKDVSRTYKDRYREGEIKEALEEMYSGLCCFCESKIGISDYEHIEHLKPKSKFPELSFEWNNLNWCCSKCNIAKGTKWNETHLILDPSIDEPKEHFAFYQDTIIAKSDRGKTTIDHANLNRSKLVEARGKILARAIDLIVMIKETNDSNIQTKLRSHLDLFAQEGEEYCSFIQDIIHKYLR